MWRALLIPSAHGNVRTARLEKLSKPHGAKWKFVGLPLRKCARHEGYQGTWGGGDIDLVACPHTLEWHDQVIPRGDLLFASCGTRQGMVTSQRSYTPLG